MRRIGTVNLGAPLAGGLTQQIDPARLEEICGAAGFGPPEDCGCTVLYVAVIMNGFGGSSVWRFRPTRPRSDPRPSMFAPRSKLCCVVVSQQLMNFLGDGFCLALQSRQGLMP